MDIFDLHISDDEFSTALSAAYKRELMARSYQFEYHSSMPRQRLAKVSVVVQTRSGLKTLEVLVKESTHHELMVLSLANKILPYSSPKVILYRFLPKSVWLVLENISTWVDVGAVGRVNENMLDGLYAIHKATLGATDAILENFGSLAVVKKNVIRSSIVRTIEELEGLSKSERVASLFSDWGKIKERAAARLGDIESITFPMALLHGSYYPNTVRGIAVGERLHVVAYDWQYSAVGYPQLDLAMLLDRLDVIARQQGLEGPSTTLLDRYWAELHDDFGELVYSSFRQVFELCYLYRVLSLARWRLRQLVPNVASQISERATLEVTVKFARLSSDTI